MLRIPLEILLVSVGVWTSAPNPEPLTLSPKASNPATRNALLELQTPVDGLQETRKTIVYGPGGQKLSTACASREDVTKAIVAQLLGLALRAWA